MSQEEVDSLTFPSRGNDDGLIEIDRQRYKNARKAQSHSRKRGGIELSSVVPARN